MSVVYCHNCGKRNHEGKLNPNHRHGMAKSKIYSTWCAMIKRCENPKDISFKNYGGKGIKVCPQWKTFVGFYKDMGGSYKEGLSIERKDNSKGYYKENCCWIPRREQSKNRSNNHKITVGNTTLLLSEWCKRMNIHVSTFYFRRKFMHMGEQEAIIMKKDEKKSLAGRHKNRP